MARAKTLTTPRNRITFPERFLPKTLEYGWAPQAAMPETQHADYLADLDYVFDQVDAELSSNYPASLWAAGNVEPVAQHVQRIAKSYCEARIPLPLARIVAQRWLDLT